MMRPLKSDKRHKKAVRPWYAGEHIHEMIAVIVAASVFFLLVALLSYNPCDQALANYYSDHSATANLGGVCGAYVADLLLFLLGSASYALVGVGIMIGYYLLRNTPSYSLLLRCLGGISMLVWMAALCTLYVFEVTQSSPGGIVGHMVTTYMLQRIGFYGTVIVEWSALWISASSFFQVSFIRKCSCIVSLCTAPTSRFVKYVFHTAYTVVFCSTEMMMRTIGDLFKIVDTLSLSQHNDQRDLVPAQIIHPLESDAQADTADNLEQEIVLSKETSLEHKRLLLREKPCITLNKAAKRSLSKRPLRFRINTVVSGNILSKIAQSDITDALQMALRQSSLNEDTFILPDISLFKSPGASSDQNMNQEIKDKGRRLQEKLEHFGIQGVVTQINPGPLITLFEYQPDINSKISKITALEDDLAMALQALSIRTIAPIPGKNAIGFEIANQTRQPVYFAQVIASKQFQESSAHIPLVFGVDVVGNPVVEDLVTMPHLLIGGTTGSGKSVGLSAMLVSMLCKRTPDSLRLILIDPKRLEFAPYADVPHLLFPIVTNPVRATQVLKWVVQEMEHRYEFMAQLGLRNILEYHKYYKEQSCDQEGNPLPPFPFIAVVIDELADLMIVAGKEVETYIVRIAQMARAAGIHMIVATQRPSVDVVTGIIKVNFPSRIAFRVSSKVDSRTILDQAGAEKLLGKGDLLFMNSASPNLIRLHGAYVSDKEIAALARHLRSQKQVEYLDLHQAIEAAERKAKHSFEDDLYEQVIAYIKTVDEISISLLQRQYRIGFNRSARIIEQLEQDGLIAPAQGSKPRKILH